MAKLMNQPTDTKPTKREVIFEDETSIVIWKYNLNISNCNPVEVEIKYKKGYVHPSAKKKTIGDLAKEAKKQKKLKGV
jgi:hypothetical protein